MEVRAGLAACALLLAACAAPPPAVVVSTGRGKVLGQDGQPAANVPLRFYGTEATPLLGDGGASIIGKTKRRLLQIELRTDELGQFSVPAGGPWNVEAVQAAGVRAIAWDVSATGPLTILKLDRTGTIVGKVSAPNRPEVTDFTGVDVYIAGTGYVAKAAADGTFLLTDVARGRFPVNAERAGLGRVLGGPVDVLPGQVVEVRGLELGAERPSINQALPAAPAGGQSVEVLGYGFGTSSGKPIQVTVGGQVVAAERLDNQRLRFPVPTGTTTVDVVVTVDGVPSLPFSLPRLVALGPADPAEWFYPGERRPGGVLGLDSRGRVAPIPGVQGQLEGPFVGGDATELVGGIMIGSTAFRVALGDASLSRPVAVIPAGVPRTNPFVGFPAPGAADGKLGAALLGKPAGMAVAPDGTLYLGDGENGRILKVTPAGDVTTLAGATPGFADGPGATARFRNPVGLALDGKGGLLVADDDNERIRRLDLATSVVSTLAGAGTAGFRDGPAAQATFSDLAAIALGPDGSVYVSEWGNHAIRRLKPDGTVVTHAGGIGGFADGPAAEAQFSYPDGLAVAPDGTVYVADGRNHAIRRIGTDSVVSTLAGAGPRTDDVGGFADGAPAKAQFYWPRGLVLGVNGTLYVGDTGNGRVRTVAPDGTVGTLARAAAYEAGVASGWFGEVLNVATAPEGRLYVADPKRRVVHRYDPR